MIEIKSEKERDLYFLHFDSVINNYNVPVLNVQRCLLTYTIILICAHRFNMCISIQASPYKMCSQACLNYRILMLYGMALGRFVKAYMRIYR